MKEKKDIVKSIVVLFVICLVVSAALAVVNRSRPPSPRQMPQSAKTKRGGRSFRMRRSLRPWDAGAADGVVSAYEGVDAGGATLGYVFTVEGKGFDGTISVMCAIGTDGAILRVSTLDVSSETKTLGRARPRTPNTPISIPDRMRVLPV